jgi:transcriptional regulator with XRE-family HTH domain
MTGDAERVKTLRQRTGKSADEIASLAGLEDMAYFDLESYDDELRTALSLGQVKRLAAAFGVPASALFSEQTLEADLRIQHLSQNAEPGTPTRIS